MDIYNIFNKNSGLKSMERTLFDRIIGRADSVYEVNITQDKFNFSQGEWADKRKTFETKTATELINFYIKRYIFPDDQEHFKMAFEKEQINKRFSDGENLIECEYRKEIQGKYLWVKSVLYLFKENADSDLVGFTYIEDINDEKSKELELIYKSEHDLLTGLFNKVTAQERIDEFLNSKEGKSGVHAFIMVDLDYFKLFNDNFGHAFGDAILSRKSASISALFKASDICGRVGGDEMIIFSKNIASREHINDKLKQLEEVVLEEYTQNGKKYKITTSLGVAFYGEDGEDFDTLYRHADIALYYSKEHGRNRITFYNAQMTQITSMVKSIDQQTVQTGNFKDNIIPFIFKILYESPNRQSTIDSVLALVGKHYNFSRAYVFEGDENRTYLSNTFEWCNDRIPPEIDNLQKMLYDDIGDYTEYFNSEGICYVPNVYEADENMRQVMLPQKIKSIIQFSIVQKDDFTGFIGFDQCDFVRKTSPQELYELKNIANIMGVFILGMRAIERSEQLKQLAYAVVDSLNSYAYVIDPDTYELLFINARTHALVMDARIGQTCHKAFYHSNEVCAKCPVCELKKSKSRDKNCLTIHNSLLGVWVRATASWMSWLNAKPACLVDSVDISEYIK